MPDIRFGIDMPPIFPPRLQVALCSFLEWVGFDYIWFPDHLLFPDFLPAPDPWSIMAAASLRTKRVIFGTAVSDPHRVHPAVLAQRLATLDQLSRGRMVFGLGSGEAMNLEPFGIPWNRRIARVKEFLQVFYGLLDSRQPLDFEGEFYRTRGARLAIRPYRDRHIPLYLAALGPMMAKVAGRWADGWMPVSLPPGFYAETFAPIAQAVRAQGRDPAALDRVATLCFSLSDHPSKLLRAVRPHALGLVWPPVAERLGLEEGVPEHLAGTHYSTVDPCDPDSRARFLERQARLPDELILQFAFQGDIPGLRRRIGELVEAGATHIKLINASLEQVHSLLAVATQVMPAFRRRRPSLFLRAAAALARGARGAGLLPEADPQKGEEFLRRLHQDGAPASPRGAQAL